MDQCFNCKTVGDCHLYRQGEKLVPLCVECNQKRLTVNVKGSGIGSKDGLKAGIQIAERNEIAQYGHAA